METPECVKSVQLQQYRHQPERRRRSLLNLNRFHLVLLVFPLLTLNRQMFAGLMFLEYLNLCSQFNLLCFDGILRRVHKPIFKLYIAFNTNLLSLR